MGKEMAFSMVRINLELQTMATVFPVRMRFDIVVGLSYNLD